MTNKVSHKSDCSLTFSSFSKQQHHRRKSIMKVFYFIFCIASASCLSFDSKDQEDFHYFLKSANDRSARSFGLSERSAPVCSEKNFTVNGDPYTLLFNEEECPKDKYIGKIIQIFYYFFTYIIISRRKCSSEK